MQKEEIQNLIRDLIERTNVKVNNISVVEDSPNNIWVAVEVTEPHFFISLEGEGLHALNHLVHRMVESKMPKPPMTVLGEQHGIGIIVDINGFQKKRVEAVRAIAHMMAERARYFKSNMEVDPMSAFERRLVHEFLANATDLKTESTGMGPSRRVVIKYVGNL